MSSTRLYTEAFSLPKGTRLNGIYEIDTFIASGGMGDIYKGHSIETGDVVAIKVMRHELAENAAALALFRKEASALHHLYHEAIVRYFVFTVEPVLQRPYLAMEFVEGDPLSKVLANGPLAFEAVWDLKNRLARGLHAAHELGIIHRDVSPDNVIVPFGDVGKAKIIDFGIARSTKLDASGTVIGTGLAGKYSYMSPEHLGMFGGEVTPRSDIYSLGLLLAEAIVGRPIDMGSSHFESIERRRVLPDLAAVDARFRPLLTRMLEPDPNKRPASMLEVASEPPASLGCSGVYSPQESAAGRKQSASRPTTSAKRSSLRIAFTVAGLVLLGGATATVYVFWPPEAHGPPEPELHAPSPAPTPRPEARPIPEPRPLPSPATDKQFAAFIDKYDGGDCFFLLPVALELPKPKIDGYGASIAPFEAFDNAFTKANNVEADIGVHQVTAAQCPAITFLSQIRSGESRGPKLELEKYNFRAGEALKGTLQDVGSRYPLVLLVSDTGTVYNLTNLLRPEGEMRRFSISLPPPGGAGEQPQLLIALTGSAPFDAISSGGVLNAASFFPSLIADLQSKRAQIGATAIYFKLIR